MSSSNDATRATIAAAVKEPVAEMEATVKDIYRSLELLRRQELKVLEAMPAEEPSDVRINKIALAAEYIDLSQTEHALNRFGESLKHFKSLLT